MKAGRKIVLIRLVLAAVAAGIYFAFRPAAGGHHFDRHGHHG